MENLGNVCPPPCCCASEAERTLRFGSLTHKTKQPPKLKFQSLSWSKKTDGDRASLSLLTLCSALLWKRARHYARKNNSAKGFSNDALGDSPGKCRKLFLLDRDGVINVDVGPPGVLAPDQLRLLPGSALAIRRLNDAGCRVVVVTNQTSIRKGLLLEADLEEIHARMHYLLAKEAGARVDDLLVATEPPWLKPSPRLLLKALESTACLPEEAVMIGDKWSDLEAAVAAGVGGILVKSSPHAHMAFERLTAGESPSACHGAIACFPMLADAVEAELTQASKEEDVEKQQHSSYLDSDDRAVWLAAGCVMLLGVIFFGLVVALRSADQTAGIGGKAIAGSPVGWVGAAGAVLIFGSSNIMVRLKSLEATEASARAGLFAAFSAMGIGVCNLTISSALRSLHLLSGPTVGLYWGLVGAADISAIQLLAFSACQALGIAAAPSIWCGIGMATSFLWGLLAFEEPLRSMPGAAAALAALAAGVAICAVAQTELPLRLSATIRGRGLAGVRKGAGINARTELQEAAASQLEKSHEMQARRLTANKEMPNLSRSVWTQKRKLLMRGLALALCVGLLDGSLMAPFKFFTLRLAGAHSQAQSSYAYLEAFGVGLLLLILPLLCGQAFFWRRRRGSLNGFATAARVCAMPGITTGAFWALANACSVHASEYLGVAVGFPLTQTAIVVNALWGIFLFKEMPTLAQRATCALGISIILTGATLLALFGKA